MPPLPSEKSHEPPCQPLARVRRGADDADASEYLTALTASVHEAVAGIQQALLWGLDASDCRGLALDAFLEITGSTWGAMAHLGPDAADGLPGLVIDVEHTACQGRNHTRANIGPVLAAAGTHVRRATRSRSAVIARMRRARARARRGEALTQLDWLLVLPVPGGTGPSSVVLLARGPGGYAEALATGVEPLLRLTGQVDTWAREVEVRRATEQELERERRRLSLALEASAVGVFELDATSGTLQWDERVWHMHGLEPRASRWTLGDWAGLLHPDDSHRVMHDLMASVEQRCPLQMQYRILVGSGEVRHLRSNAQVVEHGRGRIVVLGVNIDVTADVRLQEELAAERAQAEAVTRAKSEFLAAMSHEIRTPMNGVLGMLELLLAGGLSAEQQERAATAHASAECLLRILNDILDLSKLESHQVAIESIPYRPARIIEETVALLSPRAAEKNLSLQHDIAPEVPAWISGDPMRLRQVLLNLTGNAIKFTSVGRVGVRAALECDDRARSWLRVEITDTGEGIPAEAQPRLFQQFVQADSSTSRRFGGTGLGLAISRQLVELMGGRIGLSSTPGQGSTFWFLVPAMATVPPVVREDPPGGAPGEAADVEPLRILAVDDNAVNRRLVQAFLAKARHQVHAVEGGTEALAALRHEPFDVVLLDVQMPVMDGPTCLRQIRALEGPMRTVPVIAVTANAMAGDRERYLSDGFSDYVSKPMTMRTLSDAIARVRRVPGPRT